MALKILLTGCSGKLGKQIKRLSQQVYGPTHEEMELLDQDNALHKVHARAQYTVLNLRKCWMKIQSARVGSG